jgi:MinD-like ATPase involved in chromosome partitioning or flagellar assembly
MGETRIIGIVSGKGGVGKTTVAINLASAFLEFKKQAVIVDADVEMCGASLQLGMYNFPITLANVLNNKMSIFEAVYTHRSGIELIPTSFFSGQIPQLSLSDILSNPNLGDIILIDSPPGISGRANEILTSCKEIIPVVTPDIVSLTDTIKLIHLAKNFNVKPSGIIVNRYSEKIKNQTSLEEIEKTFELPLLGVIPEDELIRISVNERVPAFYLNPNSKVSQAFRKTAAEILGIPFEPKRPLLGKFFLGFK